MRPRCLLVAVGCLAAAGTGAAPAQAGWSRGAPVTRGEHAGIAGGTTLPDGRPRLALADRRANLTLGLVDAGTPAGPFGAPVGVLRGRTPAGPTQFATDGSGLVDAPGGYVPFTAAGVAGPTAPVPDGTRFSTAALSPAGTAVVAWTQEGAQGAEVVAAFRDPGSATFSAPVRAGYAASVDTLITAGIADDGEAVVTWQANGFPSRIAGAVREPGAGFDRAKYLFEPSTEASLAVGADGQGVLATIAGRRLLVRTKLAGGGFGPSEVLDRAGEGYTASAAAGGGRLGVGWIAGDDRRASSPVRVRIALGDGRGLHRVARLSRRAGGDRLGLALGADGSAVAAWEDARPSASDQTARSILAVSAGTRGGHFERPRAIGPEVLSITPLALGSGPGGRAFVAWEAFEVGHRGQPRSFRDDLVARRRP